MSCRENIECKSRISVLNARQNLFSNLLIILMRFLNQVCFFQPPISFMIGEMTTAYTSFFREVIDML